jgi:hypothetical protein
MGSSMIWAVFGLGRSATAAARADGARVGLSAASTEVGRVTPFLKAVPEVVSGSGLEAGLVEPLG